MKINKTFAAFDILSKLRTGAQAADRWLSLSKPTMKDIKKTGIFSFMDNSVVL
jgi:hypothetical protein